MAKYIDRISLRNSAFFLSADYSISADNSSVASGYTFNMPDIAFFDDYAIVTLNNPYTYSPQTVTTLDTTAVQLAEGDYSLSVHDMPINVYNADHDVVGNSNIHSCVFHAYNDTMGAGNSCLVESIDGNIQQTATETQNAVSAQWVIPIKFKVASTYMAIALGRLYEDGINATATDGHETQIINSTQSKLEHRLYQAMDAGTTVPAILFKEAGIADIPVYDASDTQYRLNTQIFDSLGNNAHVVASATSAHGFVKFCKALQNLPGDVELEYATVKSNEYSHDKLYVEDMLNVRWITVNDYRVLSANVTNTQSACGVINSTAINPLKYAFYDANGNYKALTADNDTIYDEYTYYCVLPTANYATSALATAAIQSLIDNQSYANFESIDQNRAPIISYSYNFGTLANDEQVFNVYDEILNFGAAYTKGVKNNPVNTPCFPFVADDKRTYTAIKIDEVDRYRNIKTYITKPQIDVDNVQRRTQYTYTYNFDSLYVVNSAFSAYNTNLNKTIYKAAAFNMIQYSNSQVAPTDQCTATCFGSDRLASTYYNFCYDAYRSTMLPAATDYYSNATQLLPIAVNYSKTTDTRLDALPTRDIYYCLTVSK